ncbi:bile acid-sensitive ion channel-like [Babylonia areolata]|uniref:bile acid-sensitive ion channel-like n=1 Tax=Babylonia areolata TaxID=304850 RepID=UPI003FD3C776
MPDPALEMNLAEYNEKKRVLKQQDSSHEEDGEKPAVRDLLVYYARHSTMHGIPSIVGSRLYRGRRIFWCCVVCVMAILLVTVIYWQMSDFYRYPTVTSVNVNYVKDTDFPSVTICDLNMFNKLFIDELDVRTQMQMTYLTEITGIFHLVGRRILDKLLKDQSLNATASNKTDTEIIKGLLDATKAMIKKDGGGLFCAWGDFYWENCNVGLTVSVTDMGVCFTVDTRKLVKPRPDSSPGSKPPEMNPVGNALRGLSLVVTTATDDIPFRLYHSEGFKVVLHDHKEDPLPQSRGFVIGANCTVEVEIEKNVRIGLEHPYKAFGTGKCVDVEGPNFVNPLKRYSYYTKEACEAECFVDFVIKTCNCRHFLHPGNETLCELEKLKKCFREAEAKHYGGGTAEERCQCPMPCRQSVFSAGVSYAGFRTTSMFNSNPMLANMPYGVTSLHLFFPDPIVTTIEQVPVYSLEGLLGSIGGQVGLFMGFSLVTVAEMCELIFLLCTRGRRLFSDDARRSFAHSNNHVQ